MLSKSDVINEVLRAPIKGLELSRDQLHDARERYTDLADGVSAAVINTDISRLLGATTSIAYVVTAAVSAVFSDINLPVMVHTTGSVITVDVVLRELLRTYQTHGYLDTGAQYDPDHALELQARGVVGSGIVEVADIIRENLRENLS